VDVKIYVKFISSKNFTDRFHSVTFLERLYVGYIDMCKSESSQSHESRASQLIPQKLARNFEKYGKPDILLNTWCQKC